MTKDTYSAAIIFAIDTIRTYIIGLSKYTIVSTRAENASKSFFTKSKYAPTFTIGSTKNTTLVICCSCSNYTIFIFIVAQNCNHFFALCVGNA